MLYNRCGGVSDFEDYHGTKGATYAPFSHCTGSIPSVVVRHRFQGPCIGMHSSTEDSVRYDSASIHAFYLHGLSRPNASTRTVDEPTHRVHTFEDGERTDFASSNEALFNNSRGRHIAVACTCVL